jgi:hypothetical protein
MVPKLLILHDFPLTSVKELFELTFRGTPHEHIRILCGVSPPRRSRRPLDLAISPFAQKNPLLCPFTNAQHTYTAMFLTRSTSLTCRDLRDFPFTCFENRSGTRASFPIELRRRLLLRQGLQSSFTRTAHSGFVSQVSWPQSDDIPVERQVAGRQKVSAGKRVSP